MLFMSVVLDGRAPYRAVLAYEKLNDETGRPMHKSWGNAIWFDDAVEKMGADVMRWLYAGQTPSQNLNFGYGPANEVKKRLLTLWNSYSFFVRYAEIEGFRADVDATSSRRPADRDAARPLPRRAGQRGGRPLRASALDGYWTPAVRRRRSRRSSTTSPTGTSAARAPASGAAAATPTRTPRSARSGTRWCRSRA